MFHFLQSLFWWFTRAVLRLRYRVEVEGIEKLRSLEGPTLVLPNHPGLIDPPLVLSHVRVKRAIRPVVTASMYRSPALYPIMRLVEALEVPDLGEASLSARERTLAMIDAIVAGLERGEWFLMYPSGRIQRRGVEVIGAARAVAAACEAARAAGAKKIVPLQVSAPFHCEMMRPAAERLAPELAAARLPAASTPGCGAAASVSPAPARCPT